MWMIPYPELLLVLLREAWYGTGMWATRSIHVKHSSNFFIVYMCLSGGNSNQSCVPALCGQTWLHHEGITNVLHVYDCIHAVLACACHVVLSSLPLLGALFLDLKTAVQPARTKHDRPQKSLAPHFCDTVRQPKSVLCTAVQFKPQRLDISLHISSGRTTAAD